ncbi:YciI family protein [Psychromarinibacter sp. C21-152]|uniref:YciI family protein n=1 Tax=Psychromarinibacter sediminicola TaxID=3033385 RepID=A0AAE3NV04_9RHOB|nr:YciI family protein [Psychromarinibacter sediminicola]MDF0602764.1 YciI family protein [Psychromarinibacter sediminicola]
MLYTLLCYHDEAVTTAWSEDEDAAVMEKLETVHQRWADRLRPVVRLMPTSAATTLRKSDDVVLDGPFAETKEQLLGFYLLEADTLETALAFARDLAQANPGGAYEVRPVMAYYPDRTAPDDAAAG